MAHFLQKQATDGGQQDLAIPMFNALLNAIEQTLKSLLHNTPTLEDDEAEKIIRKSGHSFLKLWHQAKKRFVSYIDFRGWQVEYGELDKAEKHFRLIHEFDIRYGRLRYPVNKIGNGFIKPLEADVLYSSNCLEKITDLCDGLRGLIFEARAIDMDTNPY